MIIIYNFYRHTHASSSENAELTSLVTDLKITLWRSCPPFDVVSVKTCLVYQIPVLVDIRQRHLCMSNCRLWWSNWTFYSSQFMRIRLGRESLNIGNCLDFLHRMIMARAICLINTRLLIINNYNNSIDFGEENGTINKLWILIIVNQTFFLCVLKTSHLVGARFEAYMLFLLWDFFHNNKEKYVKIVSFIFHLINSM